MRRGIPPSGRPKLSEEEIEDMAFRGGELPKDLGYGDTLMFLMYRNLYDFARRVQMDSDQGKREKARIQAACKTYRLDQDCVRYMAEQNALTDLRVGTLGVDKMVFGSASSLSSA